MISDFVLYTGDIDEILPEGAIFEGLGLDEEVPVYLRHEGPIRNIYIRHRTTVELIREVWDAKALHEGQSAPPPPTAPSSNDTAMPRGASSHRDRDSDSDVEADDVSRSSPGRPGSSLLAARPVSSSAGSKPSTAQGGAHPRPHSSAGGSAHANSGKIAGVQVPHLGAGVNLSAVAADGYVPLLSQLPATASMAEFFACFLKVGLTYSLKRLQKLLLLCKVSLVLILNSQDKVRDHSVAIELAYNIVDAVRRHSPANSDCRLFAAALEGRLPTAVWFDQESMLEKLRVSD